KIVRIEHDRHRLGLSLREARNEALLRGWQFDADGRVTAMPEDAKAAFPDEAERLEARYAERATRAAEDGARREQAQAAREADVAGRAAAMRDDGPVLTAMQAAMQQAQADLAASEASAAGATEEPEAEAGDDTAEENPQD